MKTIRLSKAWVWLGAALILGLLILMGVSVASAGTGLAENGLVHSCVNPTTGAIIIQPSWKQCTTPYTATLDWNINGTVLTGNFHHNACGAAEKNCQTLYYGTGISRMVEENFAANVLPVDGTMDVLMVRLAALDEMPRDGSFRFTVIKNGSTTALSCSIAYSSYPLLTCKSTKEIAIKAGDTVSLQISGQPTQEGTFLAHGSFAIHIR